MTYTIFCITILALLIIWYKTHTNLSKAQAHIKLLLEGGSPTVKISPIESSILDIPDEDQKYLEPIIVEYLKQLVATKKYTPTNAMLIEHLCDAIGMALEEFKPRKGRTDYQRGNEGWLLVSAYATRLYMEGTPHDSSSLRNTLTSAAYFSSDRLTKWAKHISDSISNELKKEITGETPGVKDVTEHVITAGGSKFTLDEIEDMRNKFIRNKTNGRQ